jgi:flagellar hook-associated protein 2
MSLAIDGLVSGLDTTSLINQLMTIESQPQTLLKTKVSTTQTLVSALQGLNSTVASLASIATRAALPASVDLFTAASSAASVSVSAAAGATAGQLDLSVTSIARAQVSVSAAMTAWPDSPATFTIVNSGGTKTELTAASTSLSDVADAINMSSSGVKAIRVASGTDGSGNPLYRLQLSSAATGAAGAFSIFRGTAADVTAGTATDLLAATGSATITTASDASVTLWAGTSAEQAITSSTNSFSDILPGVSITVSKVEASPVTVSITRDTAGIGAVAANLVAGLASVFSTIDAQSAVSSSTSSTGAATTTAGVFTGNGTVRDVRSQIQAAASAPVNGRSPSEIGLTVTKDGTIQYDDARFSAALAADPAGTQSMLQTIATRIAAAATTASDKYSGTITTSITGQQSSLKSLSDQIGDWDLRLASQRAGLETTYSALEVTLSNMKAQSSWLESQLSALGTGSTTSSTG